MFVFLLGVLFFVFLFIRLVIIKFYWFGFCDSLVISLGFDLCNFILILS